MGARWLRTGSDSVRMRRTTPRNPFQPLPGHRDPNKIKRIGFPDFRFGFVQLIPLFGAFCDAVVFQTPRYMGQVLAVPPPRTRRGPPPVVVGWWRGPGWINLCYGPHAMDPNPPSAYGLAWAQPMLLIDLYRFYWFSWILLISIDFHWSRKAHAHLIIELWR